MTDQKPMQRIQLAPGYEISRVIRGGWQLAGGHGAVRSDDPIADMIAFADAGITTFDCADIYTGVEELIGRFRLRYRELRVQGALDRIRVHTKFVPDLEVLPRITKAYVEGVIDQSLRRLNLECLDLVQFHWWDYDAPRWLEAAQWLGELRREGKIRQIGGTNFDTDHMLAIIEGGVPLVSMQVQYSLLDARPREHGRARHGRDVDAVPIGYPAQGLEQGLEQVPAAEIVDDELVFDERAVLERLGWLGGAQPFVAKETAGHRAVAQ